MGVPTQKDGFFDDCARSNQPVWMGYRAPWMSRDGIGWSSAPPLPPRRRIQLCMGTANDWRQTGPWDILQARDTAWFGLATLRSRMLILRIRTLQNRNGYRPGVTRRTARHGR